MSPSIVTVEAIDSIIDRTVDLLADTLKVMLVGAGYVESKLNQFIDEGGANDPVDHRIAGTTDQTLAGKALGKDTTGLFSYLSATNTTFAAVPAGATAAKAVLYKDTGIAGTSKILGVYDIADVTTNGGDIVIQWAAAASGGVLRFAV